MLVKMECPNCGAKLELDDSQNKAFCSHCGTELVNFVERIQIDKNVTVSGNVTATLDRTNEPNLIIDFASIDLNVGMAITFNNSKIKRNLFNGQTAYLHLPLGHCIVEFSIDGRDYTREIWIVKEAPVRINASHFRRNEIEIEQPPYTKDPEPVRDPALLPTGMSIAAFILSFTMLGSPIAVILAIVDLATHRDRSRKLSIPALILGVVFSIVFIVLMVISNIPQTN